MAYITTEYYYNQYGGSECEDDVVILINRASEIVDMLTNGVIAKNPQLLENPFINEQVMLATGAQADYLDRNGGLSALDSSTPVQMTLGKFSYMNGAGTSERKSFPVSSLAVGHLETAGLLIRAVSIR